MNEEPDMDSVFYVDNHYYSAACCRDYDQDFIVSPPTLDELTPIDRVPMQEIGFGPDTDEGLQAVERGDCSYFKEKRKDDPAIKGLRFFSDKIPLGSAVISPDGSIFILCDADDCKRELETRKRCFEERAPMGRLFPIVDVTEDVSAVELPPNDHALKTWVEKHFKR